MGTFAKTLQRLREHAGLSQYALAKLAGLSKQGVSRLELEEREPSWTTVQRLALALEVDYRAFADPDLTLPEQPNEPPRRGRPPKIKPAGPKSQRRKSSK